MKKIISIIATAFALPISYASAADVTPAFIPQNLHVYSTSGSTYVKAVSHTCSYSYYFLSPEHKKYDQIFSILLTAQVAKKKVKLRFDTCINGSQNPQGNIIGVYLVD